MSFDDIFISYGRKESKDFARQLHDRLMGDGFEVWFDQEDIPLGVDFQDQIDDGITKAHNFVFIISPHAIDSEYCRKEIDLAVEYKKRIIPILHVPPRDAQQEESIHPAIRRINWTPFSDTNAFDTNYKDLLRVVLKHKVYVGQHTEFLSKALLWSRNNFDSTYLLVGADRKEAETWLSTSFESEQAPCLPTDLQCELIAESKKNANNLFTDAYLCYSDEQVEQVEELLLNLIRRGITTWARSKDLRAGTRAQVQIEQGIEQADTFIIFVTESSLADEGCKRELLYADALNKRLLPISAGKLQKRSLPEALSDQNFVVLGSINLQEQVLAQLNEDKAYFHQHTKILVAAIKWQRQNFNQSILFRGFNLQESENWLRIAKKRNDNKATELQEQFVEESSQKGGTIPSEVFVSYSRADSDFARKLNGELQIHGKTTWFDQESIAPSANFQEEIFNGIKSSDNFLFIITPQSVKSPYCEVEIEHAHRLNKRFIPILLEQVEDAHIPEQLGQYQWIDFRIRVKDFHTAFSELLRALDTDRDHVSAHTRWAQAAEKWNDNARLEELLVRGVEYEMAKTWLALALSEKKSPKPSALQIEFLEASGSAILVAERRIKRANRRLMFMAILMAILAISSFFLAGWSFWLRRDAENAREQAEIGAVELKKQTAIAEVKRRDAEMAGEQARRNYERAEKERERAEKERERAETERIRAEKNAKVAAQKTNEAEANLLRANENEARAKANLERAKLNEELARKLAAEAQARLKQSKAITFIAKAREVEASDPTVAMHLALAAEDILPEDNSIKSTIRSIYYKHNFYGDFTQEQTAVRQIAYSPNGAFIAIAAQGNTIEIWNTFRQKVKTLKGHTGPVNSFAFEQDNLHLVSGSDDKTVRYWNMSTGDNKIVCNLLSPVTKVAISTGKSVQIAVVTGGNRITLWTREGTILPFLASQGGRVNDLCFSPNGKYLLSGSSDNTAVLWKLSGRKKHVLKRHHDVINKVGFSADGNYMLTASEDRNAIVWNKKGQPVSFLSGHSLGVTDVEFSADSKHILTASKDKTARLWSLSGEELQLFRGHDEDVTSVAFSPDENFILTASADHSVKIWKINTEEQQIIRTLKTPLSAFAASNKGYLALSLGTEEINLLDDNAISIRTLKGHKKRVSQLCFAPNGMSLVSGDVEGNICVWSLEGKIIGKFNVSKSEINLIQVTPQGNELLIGTSESKLERWSFSGTKNSTVNVNNVIVDASINANASRILTVSRDGNSSLWDEKGELIFDLPKQQLGATACAYRKMGTSFLIGYENGLIRQWDEQQNITRLFGGHEHGITSLTMADDDRSFVSTSDDKSARLWDMSGHQLEYYTGHKDVVTKAAFNSDGKTLITASKDMTVRRWKKSVPYEEYQATYGFSKLGVGKQLEYGLLDYDSLKNIPSSAKLLDGANYYLSKAISYDENENLTYKQHSVVLLSRAFTMDSSNVILRKRLSEAYFELSWGYILQKETGKALTCAKLAYGLLPNELELTVRYATCCLYDEKWADAKDLYELGMRKAPQIYGEAFSKEIQRLESVGIYAKFRIQAQQLILEKRY